MTLTQDSTQAGGRFVDRAMELADEMARAAFECHGFRESALTDELRAHLTTHASQQAAVVAGLEKDAARYRALMDLPGARRRVWNHVIDPHLTEGHNDLEAVLDALAASDHAMKEQP